MIPVSATIEKLLNARTEYQDYRCQRRRLDQYFIDDYGGYFTYLHLLIANAGGILLANALLHSSAWYLVILVPVALVWIGMTWTKAAGLWQNRVWYRECQDNMASAKHKLAMAYDAAYMQLLVAGFNGEDVTELALQVGHAQSALRTS